MVPRQAADLLDLCHPRRRTARTTRRSREPLGPDACSRRGVARIFGGVTLGSHPPSAL